VALFQSELRADREPHSLSSGKALVSSSNLAPSTEFIPAPMNAQALVKAIISRGALFIGVITTTETGSMQPGGIDVHVTF
jgi:hypothetical protein